VTPQASNRIVFVLALAGIGVAGYLTLAHMNVVGLGCTALRGCEEVAQHPTANGFGLPWLQAIPTAAFGLAAFGLLAALSVVRTVAEDPVAAGVCAVQIAVAVASVAVSAWLTYLEAFVIRAWCQWCIASAIITVLVLAALLLPDRNRTPISPGLSEDR
jgi:uncharacterized membrane protein